MTDKSIKLCIDCKYFTRKEGDEFDHLCSRPLINPVTGTAIEDFGSYTCWNRRVLVGDCGPSAKKFQWLKKEKEKEKRNPMEGVLRSQAKVNVLRPSTPHITGDKK